jgi:TnpA family transposase
MEVMFVHPFVTWYQHINRNMKKYASSWISMAESETASQLLAKISGVEFLKSLTHGLGANTR